MSKEVWGWGSGVGEEGKGNGVVLAAPRSPEGEHTHWLLCLEAFIPLQVGILGGVSRGFQ